MYNTTPIQSFLYGESFSNGLAIPIKSYKSYIYRNQIIKELFSSKKIIHVGCVDHLEIIESKIKKDLWMHKLIVDVSSRTLGIDINVEGIKKIQDLGYKDTCVHDIIKDTPLDAITSDNWDYIFLGEILEHVDNPVEFLTALRHKYASNINKIVISVPNAFSIRNLYNSLKNIEAINTDHRYWFTPYTVSKVLAHSGFKTINVTTCMLAPISKLRLDLRLATKIAPAFRDTVLVMAEF